MQGEHQSYRLPDHLSALALLAGVLLLLLPLAAPAADLVQEYIAASAKSNAPAEAAQYLESLSAEQLLELSKQLALAHEGRKSYLVGSRTMQLEPVQEGMEYEFGGIFAAYSKKTANHLSVLLGIIGEPKNSLLWKKMIIEYFCSKLSPLSEEDKTRLIDTFAQLRKEAMADSEERFLIYRKKRERIRAKLDQLSNPAKFSPEEARSKKAELEPQVKRDYEEILEDLRLRPFVDSHGAQSLMSAYIAFRYMGFPQDRQATADLARAIFHDKSRTDLPTRIMFGDFLLNILSEPVYLDELEKIRKDPTLQNTLQGKGSSGATLMAHIEDAMVRPLDTYDKALAFLKTLTPGDPLFNKTAVLVNRMRQDMIEKKEWTRERAQEFLATYEAARARTTDPREIGPLEGAIRIYKKELEQTDSATTSPATTSPASAQP